MYIELDFELSFPHPNTNQEKPFYFFAVVEYIKNEGWSIQKIEISEDSYKPVLNDLIEFCNPELLVEMINDAEKVIEKKITNGELW
jgi:ribosomal protein S18